MLKTTLSTTLVAVGIGICTYAYTRYRITEATLTSAQDLTRAFLEEQKLLRGASNKHVDIADDLDLASRELLGEIGFAGGMYYWYNDSLVYHGLGILLFLTGVLLPMTNAWKRPAADAKGSPEPNRDGT